MEILRFALRKPTFPIICDVGSTLVGAASLRTFAAHVATLDLPPDGQFPVVDAAARGWVFYTQYQMLSPLSVKKRWTKKDVIALFNNSSAAKRLGRQYSDRSLSAKRFDTIMTEIVQLIRLANKLPPPTT